MATSLVALLESPDTRLAALQAHLAGLDAAEKVRQCRELSKKHLARLYDVAGEGKPLVPEELVHGAPDGTPVPWKGKNSLPLFTHFEKHFVKQDGEVVGINVGSTSVFTGPGYFTCRIDPAKPAETLIDYTKVPSKKPAAWPEIKPNSAGISRFVYMNMYDYCRKVSDDVVIGAATRLGKPIGAFFVLCRG